MVCPDCGWLKCICEVIEEEVIEIPITITVLREEVQDAFEQRGLAMSEDWQTWAREAINLFAGFWNDEVTSDFVQEIDNQQQMIAERDA